jgi:hypothetical protein
MFMIIFDTATKYVLGHRADSSTPVSRTAAEMFALFLKDNNVSAQNVQNFGFAEIAPIELVFDENKYKWNETTQQVELDPSYIPPTPSE